MSKYIDIYHDLCAGIFSGEKYTDKLPTERQLMNQYNVSRTTIRRALNLLREKNIIVSQQGHGTDINIINGDARQDGGVRITKVDQVTFSFKKSGKLERSQSEIITEVITASAEVSSALQLEAGAEVYRLRWLQYVNNTPYLYLTNYIPIGLAPDLPRLVKGRRSLYRFMAAEYGIMFTNAEETIQPVISDFITSKLLDIPEGTPLLQFNRVAFSNKGPFEFSRSFIRSDIQELTLTLVPDMQQLTRVYYHSKETL